jgi:hypothetical protein
MKPFTLLIVSLSSLVRAQDYCGVNTGEAPYCTPQTWVAEPINSTAPTIAECQDACRGVESDAGDWEADLTGSADGERRTVVGYPCQFALGRGPGQADPIQVTYANQDILNIYEGVIQRFGSSGQTAATGTMICQGKLLRWWID